MNLSFSFLFRVFGLFGLALGLLPTRACASAAWVWDPAAEKALPAWVNSVRSTPGEAVEVHKFDIRGGLHPGKALAVSLYYQDGSSGLLRVLWSGPAGDILLADRLLEGVAMLNRRTLLVPEETVAFGGKIQIQCDAGSARLKRLSLDWVEPTAFYTTDEASAPYIRLRDLDIGKSEAEGAPPEPVEDRIQSRVTVALLQDAPLGISDDPAFQADLTVLPDRVLWECEVANLNPGSPLFLWINNQMAGEVSVEQPDLWDPGWFRDETSGAYRYAGWRKARFWADPALLVTGPNLFQLEAPLGFGGGPSVRRILIQAAYDAKPAIPVAPVSLSAINPQDEIPNP